MSETLFTFMLLGSLTTLQFVIIESHLDKLEKKINALKEKDNVK